MDKSFVPEIRIQYSRLLDPFFQSLFKYEQEKQIILQDKVYNSPEIIKEKILEFTSAWESNRQILRFIQDCLELNFFQELIEVYIVGFINHAISTPIIISSAKSPSDFVDILTHEILHRLISDNGQKIRTGKILKELFPEETLLCRNHVVLYAVFKKIYLQLYHSPERLELDMKRDKETLDYSRAWQIVAERGEDVIIGEFKNKY